MADLPQYHKVSQQHLANHKPVDSEQQHQVALAEAALAAHLTRVFNSHPQVTSAQQRGGFGAAPVVAGLGAAAAMAVPFTSNEVLTGPGGKPMPVQPPDPEL